MEEGSCSKLIKYQSINLHIQPQNLEYGTVEIPEKFVKEPKSHLWKNVCFDVPMSRLWKLELKLCDGHVWLHKGWKDFVKNYSITSGYRLVLRWEGGPFFKVTIFDTTALEISYSFTPPSIKRQSNLDQSKAIKEEDRDDHSSILILDVWPAENRKAPVDIHPSSDDVLGGERTSITNKRSRVAGQANNFQEGDKENELVQQRMDRAKENEEATAIVPPQKRIGRAGSSHSTLPSFSVVHKVKHWALYALYIPQAHAIKYLLSQRGKDVFLHGGVVDRTWAAKCNFNGAATTISSGSKYFVVDNDLKEGDTCMFELLSQAPNHYKVTILPAARSN